jgi:hypothetical protein
MYNGRFPFYFCASLYFFSFVNNRRSVNRFSILLNALLLLCLAGMTG